MDKHKHGWRLTLGMAAVMTLALSACGDKAQLNISQQVGGNPQMPKPKDFLVPPMQVLPRQVPWWRIALAGVE